LGREIHEQHRPKSQGIACIFENLKLRAIDTLPRILISQAFIGERCLVISGWFGGWRRFESMAIFASGMALSGRTLYRLDWLAQSDGESSIWLN
jgi:hypothetical protein